MSLRSIPRAKTALPSSQLGNKGEKSLMSMDVCKSLNSCLGLDWDDTASAFPEAFAVLVSRFQECVIITLMMTLRQRALVNF